jgi:hypothetical protein
MQDFSLKPEGKLPLGRPVTPGRIILESILMKWAD